MRTLIFVVFCLLFTSNSFADNAKESLLQLETEWAQIHYTFPDAAKPDAFERLLKRTLALTNQYPSRAEPLILHATALLTKASTQNPFSALSSVRRARELLLKAIAINPFANDGSALVTLGTLYYKLPGWPIAFGNDKEAEKLLRSALKINPQGIDSNYFFGDFLLTQDKPSVAAEYFKKAINAQVPPETALAGKNLQAKARTALINTQPQLAGSLDNDIAQKVKVAKAK